MLKIIKSVQEWKKILSTLDKANKSIGFVPTMGALHSGHRSLILKSVKENDITVTSIFINPTQFNNPDDLKNYPKTLKNDIRLLTEANTDYLFLPDTKDMYLKGYNYKIIEEELSKKFCGAHRPGHFDGVLSIVMKLLNIIEADKAYFGEKDWQQFKLIEGMTESFFINTKLIPCPIIRENDGLAFSSRNTLLTKEHRNIAPVFYKILSSGKPIERMKTELIESGFEVDYIEIYRNRILGAVRLGKVRLIDNVKR